MMVKTKFPYFLCVAWCALNLNLTHASDLADQDLNYLRQLHQDGFYSFAQIEADSFLKQYPNNPFLTEVYLIAATASLSEQKLEQGQSYLQQLLELEPDEKHIEQAQFLLAEINVLNKNYPQALDKITQFEYDFPDSPFEPQVEYLKAKIAFEHQQYEQSLEHLLGIRQNLPPQKQLSANLLLGWSYYFLEQRAFAEAYFLELLKYPELDFNQKTNIQLKLAEYAQQEQNLDQAAIWWSEILGYPWSSETVALQFIAADALFATFQSNQVWAKNNPALQQQVLDWHSQNLNQTEPQQQSVSLYQRAWLYVWQGQLQLAKQDLEQQTGFTVRSTVLLSWLHQEAGEQEKAQQVLARVIKNPEDAYSAAVIAVQFVHLAQQIQACEAVEQQAQQIDAVRFKAQRAQADLYLADCLFAEGEYETANIYYAQAELKKETLPFLLRYWQSLVFLQDYQTALDSIQKVKIQAWSLGEWPLLTLRELKYHRALKNWEASILTIGQLLIRIPKNKNEARWYFLLAQNYEQVRAYSLAEQNYQFVMHMISRQNPQFSQIRQKMAGLYTVSKQYTKLIRYYAESLAEVESQAQKNQIRLYLAQLWHNQLDDSAKSAQWLQQLEQPSRSVVYQAQILVAEIAIKKQQYKTAIETLQRLTKTLKLKEDKEYYVQVNFRLAEIYHLQEAWKNALAYYKKVAKSELENHQSVKLAKQRSQQIAKYLNNR